MNGWEFRIMGNPEKQAKKPGNCGSTGDLAERPGATVRNGGPRISAQVFTRLLSGKTLITSDDTLL
jgi:hypothetical protein